MFIQKTKTNGSRENDFNAARLPMTMLIDDSNKYEITDLKYTSIM